MQEDDDGAVGAALVVDGDGTAVGQGDQMGHASSMDHGTDIGGEEYLRTFRRLCTWQGGMPDSPKGDGWPAS